MKMRTSKPASSNKYYKTTSKGGYSWAVKGSPTDSCDVLANCVGYANGRFAEIQGKGKIQYQLVCNAENFIEKAKSYGLKVSNKPTLGGIMVWQKGSTLNGNDGAGHVAIVEKIYNSNKIYTSESGWGGPVFWNSTRTNTNGRWGQSSAYKFRGCIINPAIGNVTAPASSNSNSTTNYTIGNYKTLDIMKIRTGAGVDFKQKKVKDLTADGKKNATSTSPNAYACYKKGTIFTATKILKDSKGNIWAKTPSGYICIKEGKTAYCKKI